MKLRKYEEVCFITLVIILSYCANSLFSHTFYGNTLSQYHYREGMEENSEELEEEEEELDPDYDINNADYTKQMKNVKKFGFSKEGSWSTLQKNVKGIKGLLEGIVLDQTKLTKKGNPVGVKYAVNTGFTCNDPEGSSHKQYTYIDSVGDPNLGLAFEVGNSVMAYGDSLDGMRDALSSSEDKTCKEVEIKTISNSGVSSTQTVHLDSLEIDKIKNKDNILSTKTYTVPEEVEEEQEEETEESEESEEGFKSLHSASSLQSLLIYDDLFYKDYGVFAYFTLLNMLFLYFIFIILINN